MWHMLQIVRTAVQGQFLLKIFGFSLSKLAIALIYFCRRMVLSTRACQAKGIADAAIRGGVSGVMHAVG